MNCANWHELISASLDGELGPLETTALDTHLAHCAGCVGYRDEATRLSRTYRLRAADDVPDLVAPILARAAAPHHIGHREIARIMLAWVSLVQLAFALPALVLGDSSGSTAHAARDLGSFDVAIAIGLLGAAWLPRWATALLPVAAALVGAITLTASLDIVHGRTSTGLEAHHVVDLVGFALLWFVAGRPLPHRSRHRALIAA